VVLLHVLCRLAPAFGLSLRVLHINHQLRGRESDEDEQFVRELAREMQLEIEVVQAPVAASEGNLEQTARDFRRSACISSIASGRVDRVALGHTRSDQAETVLFRLLRGTGLTGLAGMPYVSDEGLVRPLLFLTREEVRTWAAEQQLRWREDSSNQDPRFRRNFIRRELLPLIKTSLNPAVESVLARSAEVAQGEEDYWDRLLGAHFEAFAKQTHHGLLCDANYLNTLHLAVQRRLLRRTFAKVKGDLRLIDSAHVDAVLAICRSYEGHDRVQIPGIDALRSYKILRIAEIGRAAPPPRHYQVPVILGQEVDLPFYAGKISLQTAADVSANHQNCANFLDVKDRREIVNLNPTALGGTAALKRLVVRNWEPGDEYQPVGHRSVKKVKELFQESRVLLWERRHWPVLDLNGEIIWVRRFGPAAKFEMEQDQAPAVSLTYVAAP
jgi:tRNA(Ile)-lysidine synthase